MMSNLKEIIIDTIAQTPEKQITFAQYMNLALYHPQEGYYSSKKKAIGSQGDFFTSSSLGKDFGELLAEQFVEMWEFLECPNPFILVEMGAGEGILAGDILNYLEQNYPNFLKNLEYIIIERGFGMIEKQKALFQQWQEKKFPISWKSWEEIPDDSVVGCCFSNELIDAFSVHKLTVKLGELQEIYVSYSENQLIEKTAQLSTSRIREYFQLVGIEIPSEAYIEGYQTEVNLAALDWLKTVAAKLKKGYLLTIDYGYPASKYYHPQRFNGTLQCYYQHRYHSNPYVNIGQQDITCHVDFTALELFGESLGLAKVGFTKQGIFLMALGLGERLISLSSGKFNLSEVLYRRDALHQLINPAGLGGFGVLLQSKNLENNNFQLKGLMEYSNQR